MRISTSSTILALSSLALLTLNGVQAKLTPEERLAAETKYPDNPNYCPPCLQKAMINHFPHACPKDLEPIAGTERPNGPRPEEQRCVCVSFMDLYWMKTDCEDECTYVHDADAMTHFVKSKDLPGCDRWIDFKTGLEKEVEGFEKKNPEYKPAVYDEKGQVQEPKAEESKKQENEKEEEKKKVEAPKEPAEVEVEAEIEIAEEKPEEFGAEEIVAKEIVAEEAEPEDVAAEEEEEEVIADEEENEEVVADEVVPEEITEEILAQEIGEDKAVPEDLPKVASDVRDEL